MWHIHCHYISVTAFGVLTSCVHCDASLLESSLSKTSQKSNDEGTVLSNDGRRQRSERSRQAIMEAALDMMNDGILAPTAQQIAERAGVGIRSFFRHFSDMESLFLAVDEESRESTEALFIGGDRNGTLPERVLHAVERHANAYEIQANAIRSTKGQLWRWDLLRKNYERYQRGLRKDLDDWLPELKALPVGKREAVDALASAEMWLRLRDQQGMSKKHSIEIVVDLLLGLIPLN
jgi:AcrR family transcriptional regulator